MDTELTQDEIQVLLEALEAWVLKDESGAMLSSLVGGLLTDRHDEVAKAEWEMQQRNDAEERKAQRQLRKNRATLLGAKLLTLAQKVAVSQR